MKTDIHPKFYTDTKVTCNCGNSFITGSTIQSISVEVCYKCHPFYTGEQRFLDTKGRVEEFQRRQKQATEYKTKRLENKTKKDQRSERQGKSLRELLGEV